MQNGSNHPSNRQNVPPAAGGKPNPAQNPAVGRPKPSGIPPQTQSRPNPSGATAGGQNPAQPRSGGGSSSGTRPTGASGGIRRTQNPRRSAERAAPNGAPLNGVPSNGVPSNGVPSNGIRSHGAPSHGVTSSGSKPAGSKPTGMAPSSGAAVTAPPKKKETAFGFLRRTFAVDKTVLEQRAIVREQGSFDYVFLVIVLVLLAFGTVMVYSASYAYSKNKYDDSYYIIFRQAIFIFVGFIGMAVAMAIKPEVYKKFAVPIYIVCFFMLCLVPIPGIGVVIKGARRWISLGFTNIQPSEFMKLGLVFMLAWYMDRYYERVTDYKHFGRSTFFGIFVPFVIVGATCGLVVIEKHLSGTIIMFLIGIIVIFAGGGSFKVLATLGGIGGAGLLAFGLLTDYTKRRFDIWLNPEAHPTDGGWQTLQGLYAIGSGGFFGVGLGESRQKHLYVSEPQNDFIFTIVCEELGFIGAITVVVLFCLFIYRGFVIAMKAPDTFSSLMVMGIVGKVATQAVLNIAVVTNAIPNTGISLPFFSYGGSSLVILMIEMGVVLSLSRFSKQRK